MTYNEWAMQLFFTGKQQESGDVWSFIFTPKMPFTWVGGQSLRVEVAGPYGPLEHRFSISSAPSSGVVVITTRLTGRDYKESLAALQHGDSVVAHGLDGNFTWRQSKLPHIFVAAGIGITPFRAMIAEQIAQNRPASATLLYSSRDEPMVYADTLNNWHVHNPQLDVQFYKNRITATTILSQPQASERFIYIAGPSKMVGALHADLLAAGISPAQVLHDQFTGQLPLDG